MRILGSVLGCLLLLSPSWTQDAPDAVEKRLQKKIDAVLAEETGKLLRDLTELVRRELSGSRPPSPVPVPAGMEAALEGISSELLQKHVTFLASDELQGRNAGYPGNDKATEYIADVFREAGLKPGGDEGTYFQGFSIGSRKTRNCVGILEGTDPILRKEYVVVGAHHDHVGSATEGKHFGRIGGSKGDDQIWNGADDNASGTSVVLSLAKAFGSGGIRTRRSILFLTFSGEEGGLVGSRYYVNHPVVPIEDHIFMLNLDMVGRNPNRPVEVHGVASAEGGVIRSALDRAVSRTGLKVDIHEGVDILGGDSDHTSFRNKKVPFTFFFTGFHPDYHSVSDHADKLSYENMVRVGRSAGWILQEIADAPERTRFSDKGAPAFRLPEMAPAGGESRRRLGVSIEDLEEGEFATLGLKEEEGGIRIRSVSKDSVAAKAGLQEGDVIVAIGGTPLPRVETLGEMRKRLEKVKAGEEVEVAVLREAKRVTVKAVWDK